MFIEYQTGLHAANEFEVMRASTAELFSHNAPAVRDAVEADHIAMAGTRAIVVDQDEPRNANTTVLVSYTAAAVAPIKAQVQIAAQLNKYVSRHCWNAYTADTGSWVSSSEI